MSNQYSNLTFSPYFTNHILKSYFKNVTLLFEYSITTVVEKLYKSLFL